MSYSTFIVAIVRLHGLTGRATCYRVQRATRVGKPVGVFATRREAEALATRLNRAEEARIEKARGLTRAAWRRTAG